MLLLLFFLTLISNCIATTLPPFLQTTSSWAENTLQGLTLRQKIGQLFMVAATSNPTLLANRRLSPYPLNPLYIEKLIQQYGIGGLIFLYESDPKTQMRCIQQYQEYATIPLLIAQDCEWGLAMRLKNVIQYPHNMTLGALENPDDIYQLGYEIGKECLSLGIHMNLAPVLDVNNNKDNPVIHDRSFGDDPFRVGLLGIKFAHGLQDAGVLACAKHFPGHGDTTVDSHDNLPTIHHSFDHLESVELFPFKEGINNGISSIMTAHLHLPELDPSPNQLASMSPLIVTQLLKESLQFKGLVITDGLGMRAVTNYYQPGHLEVEAFLAGNDILLCPLDVPMAIDLIENAIITGKITQQQLDTRVFKILKAKEWAFAQQKEHMIKLACSYITRPETHSLQQALYQNAITLVKNKTNIQFSDSLLEQSCIIQIGSKPLFQKIAIDANLTIHQYSALMDSYELADALIQTESTHTVIMTIGSMNKNANTTYGIASNTLELLHSLLSTGKTVIIVLLGTPYSIPLFKDAHCIIEAYEDIFPAQVAVMNVLRGREAAQGILPIHIPN